MHRHKIWISEERRRGVSAIAAGAFAHIRQDEDADPPTGEPDGDIFNGDGYERKAIDSIVNDQTGKVEVNDNQFVLRGMATWDYWIRVPGLDPGLWKSVLWNDTDDVIQIEDSYEAVGDSTAAEGDTQVTSYLSGRLNLLSDREFEIRTNSEASTLCTPAGFEGPDEIYTEGLFRRNPDTELIHFQHREDPDTSLGAFSAQTWVARDFTDIVYDDTGAASISDNEMTIPAGTYYVIARAAGYQVNQHKLALWNETDSEVTLRGLQSYSGTGTADASTAALLFGKFTIASAKAFKLLHRCATTGGLLGVATGNPSADATTELYVSVEFRRLPGSGASEFIHIVHEEDRNTQGGDFTSGSYQVRPITAILTDDTGEASLSSNQITLPVGTYIMTGFAQAFACGTHRLNLWDVAAGGQVLFGATENSFNNNGPAAFAGGLFTVADSPKTFEIRHRCGTTRGTNGLGIAMNAPLPDGEESDSVDDMNERYADIIFEKIA